MIFKCIIWTLGLVVWIPVQGQEDLYQQYRDWYRSYFVRNSSMDTEGNLLADGIGEWRPYEAQYTLYAEGYPASRLRVHGSETILEFGGENGIRMGYGIAMLAMEYTRYQQMGLTSKSTRSLNELFLMLQAYRRLDMMANRLLQKYYEECQHKTCDLSLPEGGLRFDGYSGFFMRDDAFFNISRACDDHTLCPRFATGKLVDMLEKLRKKDPACKENGAEYVCCMKALIETNMFNSQDQMIGVLHGISIASQLLPEDVHVVLNGEPIYLHNLLSNIAHGIYTKTSSCSRKLKVPSCQGGCGFANHGTGSNAKAFYKGIAAAVERVLGVPYQSKGLLDHYLWGVSIPVSTATLRNNNSVFNTRLFIKLAVAGRLGLSESLLEDAMKINYYAAPLEYALLYGKEAAPYLAKWLDTAVSHIDKTLLIPNGGLVCTDTGLIQSANVSLTQMPKESDADGWCFGGPLESFDYPCSYAGAVVESPLQWLYMYNLRELVRGVRY